MSPETVKKLVTSPEKVQKLVASPEKVQENENKIHSQTDPKFSSHRRYVHKPSDASTDNGHIVDNNNPISDSLARGPITSYEIRRIFIICICKNKVL